MMGNYSLLKGEVFKVKTCIGYLQPENMLLNGSKQPSNLSKKIHEYINYKIKQKKVNNKKKRERDEGHIYKLKTHG